LLYRQFDTRAHYLREFLLNGKSHRILMCPDHGLGLVQKR
jgi:hypothetical protein